MSWYTQYMVYYSLPIEARCMKASQNSISNLFLSPKKQVCSFANNPHIVPILNPSLLPVHSSGSQLPALKIPVMGDVSFRFPLPLFKPSENKDAAWQSCCIKSICRFFIAEPGLGLCLAAIQQNLAWVFACGDGQWVLLGQDICKSSDLPKRLTQWTMKLPTCVLMSNMAIMWITSDNSAYWTLIGQRENRSTLVLQSDFEASIGWKEMI